MEQVVAWSQYCHDRQDDHNDADDTHFETGEKKIIHLLLSVCEIGAKDYCWDWDKKNAADGSCCEERKFLLGLKSCWEYLLVS